MQAPADAEFAWSARDFDEVRRLILERAGITLNDGKQALVYSRLSRRLRVTGHRRFSEYLAWLQAQPADSPQWQDFVNTLTTNLTAFWREPHHFDLLARRVASEGPRPWRGWCCAASTGEEPYSIAMTLEESLPHGARWELLASDIDTSVLAQARDGIYAMDRLDRMDPARLRRHFLRGSGPNAGLARVRPHLAAGIRFMHLNLVDASWPVEPGLDFIFCRNVLIYFEPARQRALVRRFHSLLAPGGLLFVGHAESLSGARELFRPVGRTTYQRS